MRALIIALGLSALWAIPGGWETDFAAARTLANQRHQLILLNFSGSDWCNPCIRLKREVFEDAAFRSMADSSLVLYNADFPRKKSNALDPHLKSANERLADQYNPEGHFPFTVLLDSSGKVVKTWDGFPQEGKPAFIETLNRISHEYVH